MARITDLEKMVAAVDHRLLWDGEACGEDECLVGPSGKQFHMDAVTCQIHGGRVCGNSVAWIENTPSGRPGNVCARCLSKV